MRCFAFAALAAAISFGASSARADDRTHRLATEHIRKANALYEKEQFDAARAEYAAACDLVASDACFRGLAQTELDSGRFLEAYGHVKRIEGHKGAVDAMPAEARAGFMVLRDAAYAHTGHVAVDAPAHARVSFDGVPQGEAPLAEAIDTLPGEHTVEATVNGTVAKLTIVALAGSVVQARLVTAPSNAEPTPAITPIPPPPGVPPVASSAPATDQPPATSPPASSARTTLALSALGVAVVGLGVGIGFKVAAESKSNDLSTFQMEQPGTCANPGSSTCAESHSLRDDAARDSTISTVGYVVAGVGVAGAAAFWLFWPKSPTQAAWLLPSVGARGAELQVGGRF